MFLKQPNFLWSHLLWKMFCILLLIHFVHYLLLIHFVHYSGLSVCSRQETRSWLVNKVSEAWQICKQTLEPNSALTRVKIQSTHEGTKFGTFCSQSLSTEFQGIELSMSWVPLASRCKSQISTVQSDHIPHTVGPPLAISKCKIKAKMTAIISLEIGHIILLPCSFLSPFCSGFFLVLWNLSPSSAHSANTQRNPNSICHVHRKYEHFHSLHINCSI